MNESYREWIETNVTGTGYGKCREYSHAMATFFPELRIVRGHYHCEAWGERAHWWLVAPDGSIVDPTATQFPTRGMGEYIELDEDAPQPTGKCCNCGGLIYNGDAVCSVRCHEEMIDFLAASGKR